MSQEEIDLINKILKPQVFEDNVDFIFDTDANIHFKINVKGTKKMISVGEYYDYIVVDVTLIDFDQSTKKILNIFTRDLRDSDQRCEFLLNWLKKDYRFMRGLISAVSGVLSLFSDNKDHVRVTIDNIIISDYLKDSVDNIVLDF